MKRIELPGNTSVSDYAFSRCEKLVYADVHSAELDGEGIFFSCTSLLAVSFPSAQKNVPALCFAGCTSLQEIRLPEKVEKLGRMPFSHCTALEKILVPSKAEMNPQGTAEDCSPVLKSVTLYPVRK